MIRRSHYKGDEYHRERNRLWAYKCRQNKWRWLKEQLGPCCTQCGATERLELDHIDPSLKEYKGRVAHRSYAQLTEELDNLQILCHTCHCKRTAEQIRNGEVINGHRAEATGS